MEVNNVAAPQRKLVSCAGLSDPKDYCTNSRTSMSAITMPGLKFAQRLCDGFLVATMQCPLCFRAVLPLEDSRRGGLKDCLLEGGQAPCACPWLSCMHTVAHPPWTPSCHPEKLSPLHGCGRGLGGCQCTTAIHGGLMAGAHQRPPTLVDGNSTHPISFGPCRPGLPLFPILALVDFSSSGFWPAKGTKKA